MKRSTWIGGAAALASVPTRALGQAGPKVRITTIPIDQGAQPYFAAELGLFEKHGLNADVQTLTNGEDTIAAIVGGSVDIGNSNIMTVSSAHTKQLPIALLGEAGLYNAKLPTAYILVAASSPIRTAKDLNGKTVGVNGLRGITEIAVRNWVDKNGGDSTAIKFVDMPFTAMQAVLVAGRIDAAMLPEPVVTFDLQKGGTRILTAPFDAIAPRFAIGGWVAKKDWIAANQAAVRAFNDAMRDAARWANDPANHEQSAEILFKYTKIRVGKANRILFGEHLVAAEIQPEIDVAARYRIIPQSFPAAAMFAPSQARE